MLLLLLFAVLSKYKVCSKGRQNGVLFVRNRSDIMGIVKLMIKLWVHNVSRVVNISSMRFLTFMVNSWIVVSVESMMSMMHCWRQMV